MLMMYAESQRICLVYVTFPLLVYIVFVSSPHYCLGYLIVCCHFWIWNFNIHDLFDLGRIWSRHCKIYSLL